MKLILVSQDSGTSRAVTLRGWMVLMLVLLILGVPAVVGFLAYRYGLEEGGFSADLVASWQHILDRQRQEIDQVSQTAREDIQASALRLAQLQARIVRLDALGARLTEVAKLDEGEFDFSQQPAQGGPVLRGPESDESSGGDGRRDFIEALERLATDVESRGQQLSVLETLLVDRKIQRAVFLAGRPVKQGWMSSRFGRRTDPINGRLAWHNGVDFAARTGSDVITVAAGVVVYAGPRSGYGKMVEINHGGGFSSRYGHHEELYVNVGDIVKKGETIGLMGSSGRSTGPHVHFEIYKDGRAVDPSSYIHRSHR